MFSALTFTIKVSSMILENNKMKLLGEEAELTGLWAGNCATIQQVWILKFALGPKKFPGLSKTGPKPYTS